MNNISYLVLKLRPTTEITGDIEEVKHDVHNAQQSYFPELKSQQDNCYLYTIPESSLFYA